MNSPHQRISPLKYQPPIDYYVKHYFDLFWRWKWYICFVTPILFLILSFFIVKYGPNSPALESKVVLEFASAGGTIGQQNLNIQQASMDAFLHSRSFLQTIVEKLSLQIYVKRYFRDEIFDSISIGKEALAGQYNFVINKDEYTLFYSNNSKKIFKKVIADGKLIELASFSLPFVYLKFSQDFIATPHSMTFYILNMREAVDRILWQLSVKFPGMSERDNSIMTIGLKGGDYPLTTKTVNTIADDFVARNNEEIQNWKSDNAQTLENQLQRAKSDLAGAEAALRQFREANPSSGPAVNSNSSISEASNLATSIMTLQRAIDDALTLQSRCATSPTIEDQITAMYEAITFLSAHQSIAAPALQIELNEAENQKRRVDADYAPQHPLAIENKKKISRLVSNVSKALTDAIGKMRTDLTVASNRKNSISEEFQKLPVKELRYAELERRRATLAEVYSNTLARYNTNKMSEKSQGIELTILDRAVAPIASGRLQFLLQFLLGAFIAAIIAGFGPPVGIDYLDKRARNEGDCRRFSTLPFLEGIPYKNGDYRKMVKPNREKLDDRLVGASFEQIVFTEMYRSLRTKILLHLHGEAHKMLVVTSLNPGEGKSLTAANLSIVMAQQKLRTLLIDGDLRRGVQHHSFLLEKKPGLSEILASPDDLAAFPVNSAIQMTHIPYLSLLACGMSIPNPAECMNSAKFRDLISTLAEWYDVVVLDTPPLRMAVDAAILPEAFNHYIIVARAAITNLDALERKINDFPGLRQKALGIVLNGAPVDKKLHNYNYSYYQH